jgi:hypothetical protein
MMAKNSRERTDSDPIMTSRQADLTGWHHRVDTSGETTFPARAPLVSHVDAVRPGPRVAVSRPLYRMTCSPETTHSLRGHTLASTGLLHYDNRC